MVQTQIELSEKQMEALEALANQRHTSVSDIVRESIDYLLQAEPTFYSEDQKQKALAAAGRFKSGLGDLSKRHDDYLSEAATS